MNFGNLKDPLIVAALFFVIGSDWFDGWLKDLFPSLRSTNPMMFTLMKTVVFGVFYWIYNNYIKSSNGGGTNGNGTKTPAASSSGA